MKLNHERLKLVYGERKLLDSVYPNESEMNVCLRFFRSRNLADFKAVRNKYYIDYLIVE